MDLVIHNDCSDRNSRIVPIGLTQSNIELVNDMFNLLEISL